MIVNLPCRILVEKSVDKKLAGALEDAKLGKNCMIVFSEGVRNIAKRAESAISGTFHTHLVQCDSVEKGDVEKLAARSKKCDFLVGMGGGRTIDAAKYAAYLAKKEWVAFPTVLSHDGVVSSRAIINNSGLKTSVEAKEPAAIIADLETIRKSPYRYTASGAGDLISNISAVEDWRIADRAGKEKYHTVMANLSLLAAESAIDHANEIRKKDYHGLEILLWSLICSGFAMNIYGSSRPCSGSEHNFSHALDSLGSGALHGEQVALGTIISVYLQAGDWKNIKAVMKKIGLPTDAEEIGIEKNILIKALAKARRIRDRYTILNKYNLNEKKAGKILKDVGII